jgi:hypothetical protein
VGRRPPRRHCGIPRPVNFHGGHIIEILLAATLITDWYAAAAEPWPANDVHHPVPPDPDPGCVRRDGGRFVLARGRYPVKPNPCTADRCH